MLAAAVPMLVVLVLVLVLALVAMLVLVLGLIHPPKPEVEYASFVLSIRRSRGGLYSLAGCSRGCPHIERVGATEDYR
jgi:hypothetical protein